MKTVIVAFLIVVALAASAPDGIAGEQEITDIKELAGTWRGWVTATVPSLSTMTIKEDGSYRAASTSGSMTVGQYYLEDGKLRYRSTRSVGKAILSEDKGRIYLLVIPDNTDAMGLAGSTGKTEYERVK
jgi:hypothetical protein